MKTLLRLLLKSQNPRNRSKLAQTEKGMTLVELLVGSIMAFLIITPMLGFVVDMLNTDRREQVKSNTEQDLQAAVDFISQDLSQAIYIYDDNPATGIPELIKQKFIPTGADKTPIMVFWKRQLQKNALPVTPTAADTPAPNKCKPDAKAGEETECNDTYVLSLVAYYQINDNNATWCQPSGGNCPTRIARYQIRDGLKDPKATDPNTNPYYTSVNKGQEPSAAFNRLFDISKPAANVTTGDTKFNEGPDVLVNYIDHTPKTINDAECKTALGNPTDPKDTTKFIDEATLKVTDTKGINSFYACVDTARNVARVTIRGNSLRRLQPSEVSSSVNNSAFFPTATVQVQGLGGIGK